MKLLYLSCHAILEYDEIKLFDELGIEVFSHGVYRNPPEADDPIRPGLPIKYYQDLYYLSLRHGKEDLPQEMIDWADVIYCQHVLDWLALNWHKMTGKRRIWRSIGQSTVNVENMAVEMRKLGMEIVRYSPRERTIPNYQGEDAMIRFYKDPEEFNEWTGEQKTVLTFGQSMKDRDGACNWSFFEEATRPYDRVEYGKPSKSPDPLYLGQLNYEAMKNALRTHRVYFYTGTYPASYTLNFIEAMMTGIPVVAIGPQKGNSPHEIGQNTYEIPDIINNGVNGFYSDDITEIRFFIDKLMNDLAFAKKIGEAGRQTAIELFSKEKIKNQWKEYLNV